MKRLLWVAFAATAGALVLRTVRRRAAKLTPAGMSGSVGSAFAAAADSIRRLADEVRVASAERETELIAALDLPDPAAAPARAPAAAPAPQSRA